jgi:hypothetical protein
MYVTHKEEGGKIMAKDGGHYILPAMHALCLGQKKDNGITK